MKAFMKSSLVFSGIALAAVTMSACQSDKHAMVEAKDGTVIVCKGCYDQIFKMQHSRNFRGGGTTYEQVHTRHACPYCKTEMSIYTEDGVTKVKCAKCAPEGLDCDKCLPPAGYVPPAS